MYKKSMKIVLVLLFASFILAYVVSFKPYIESKYERVASSPIDLLAVYKNATGSPLCSKFYEVIEGKVTTFGVFPNFPVDLLDPHNVKGWNEGEQVIFTGYLYQWKEINLVTGKHVIRKINLIDVISWKPLNGDIHQTKSLDHQPSQFMSNNYVGCR